MNLTRQIQRSIRRAEKGKWHRSQTRQPTETPTLIVSANRVSVDKKKAQKPSLADAKRRIVLDFCYQDDLNKDKVYTKDFEKIIYKQLENEVGKENAVLSYNYGDVLNRFGI